MEKKITTSFKSSYFNLLMPIFFKYSFYMLFFFIILYLIKLLILTYIPNVISRFEIFFHFFLWIPFFTWLFSIGIIGEKMNKIYYTKYTLYQHHIEKKFYFLCNKIHSINYNQITDMRIEKNFWDILYRTGNLYIYTGADSGMDKKSASLILPAIETPEKLREVINRRIHNSHKYAD